MKRLRVEFTRLELEAIASAAEETLDHVVNQKDHWQNEGPDVVAALKRGTQKLLKALEVANAT